MQAHSETPLLYQPLTTRKSIYPAWVIIKSSPLPTVVHRADIGNDICALLLSSQHALSIPSLLDNVAESLSWILETAPLPIAAACHNIVRILYLTSIPGSNVYLFDAHVKIVLAVVVDFLICAWDEALEKALIASHAYLQQHWEGRFTSVPFKSELLDIYEFLSQAC
jgi:hypothetical protein